MNYHYMQDYRNVKQNGKTVEYEASIWWRIYRWK